MVQWRFTTAIDGNLATHVGDDPAVVVRNRAQLASHLGITPDRLAFMNQVHGNGVALAGGATPEADALVTSERGLALVVLVADCIPLLLFDTDTGVIGAAHVGRRGLVNGVALRTIEAMRDLGAGDIAAQIGPAICGQCYEVPEALQSEVLKVVPTARALTREGTAGLDIRNGLQDQLHTLGIAVSRDPRCTRESMDLFSYRREPKTGRFAGVIMVA